MNRSEVKAWIDSYIAAWRSPDTSKLVDLFTPDVSYQVSPWKLPLHGLQELEIFWKHARSGHTEVFELQSAIVAVEGTIAVVRIEVTYEKGEPRQWRDLWILTFTNEGLCSSFEEWPFSPAQDDGQKEN